MIEGIIMICDQVSEFFLITGVGGQQKIIFFTKTSMVPITLLTTFK